MNEQMRLFKTSKVLWLAVGEHGVTTLNPYEFTDEELNRSSRLSHIGCSDIIQAKEKVEEFKKHYRTEAVRIFTDLPDGIIFANEPLEEMKKRGLI